MEKIEEAAGKISENIKKYGSTYGVPGLLAVAAVIIKVITFYNLMNVRSNMIVICLITLLFTYLLFKAFRNKWIPAVIFTLLSVLMFADVTYSSFFNRYLSVGMIGAAEVVGDIGESIKEVIKPVNFVMFIDVIMIFATLIVKKKLPVQEAEDKDDLTECSKKDCDHGKRRYIYGIVLIILILLVASAPFGSRFLRSVSNQEFYTFHVKDIITAVRGGENDENLSAWTDSYESEKNGELFGAAKGKNLIICQIESLQDFVIGREYNGQEITPNLNKLLDENTTYFDNFYCQVGSGNTSDAEFAVNNSLYGTLTSYTYKLFNQNYYRGLPVQLAEEGYDTAVFHAYEDRSFWSREAMYPNEGFGRFYGGLKGRDGDYNMTDWMGWGLTDSEFFPQTVEYMKGLKKPFYSFVITLSNHHPYQMLEKYKFIDLLPEDRDTIVGNYIQSAAYTDYAIGCFIDELKEAGMYEDSVFVFYGDHAGLTHSEEIDESMGRILGKPYDFEEMMKIPLIIHMPDSTYNIKDTIMTAGGQTDVMPTLAYLFGLDRLDTIYVGHNLYNIKEGFVAEQTYMTKGSFFTNDIAYEMSRDGVFENGRAWNIHTGEEVPVDKCYDGYIRSMAVVNTSEHVLKSNAIKKIFVDGMSAEEIDKENVSRTYPSEIVYAGYPDTDLIGTNSEEALKYSVYAGNRNLRLDIKWDEESMPYTVNEKTGNVEMRFDDIVRFMQDNGGVYIYFNVEKSGDYLIKILNQASSSIGDRVIADVPDTEEYSGRFECILDASESGRPAEKIREFAEKNKVWAVMIDKGDAEGRYRSLIGGKTRIYINDEENGIITKAD